ncbi:MAG TPA: LysR substrate-binding domain-containing protein [Bradyrhizobium sp.]|uniref:LysR family transcriptional regulator n=1 Tax=Bradyrhizobium sp. TaxID=376 RepID=UPI002B90256D|nr:LysR substrate-binding domain-containing protein [Bradyrhizobium sp.]HLZ03351.1 LysR substrate-binding domain-containing protein [Bradyrhizobium sp.]
MTLEQLRIFVAVAELEHVTRAAQRLNLTQSATSAAIAALEERYATRLFDRIGRNIRLTDAGRQFLPDARAVLARAGAAEAALSDFSGLKRGHLSVAASQTAGNYWLPAPLFKFRKQYPGISIDLRIGNTEQVANWVEAGQADLGVVEGDVDAPTLSVHPIIEDELVLVVGPTHAYAKRRALKPQELRNIEWVVREKGSGTRAVFEAALKKFGITLKEIEIALELPSNEAVRTAVQAGAGATLISRLVAGNALRAGTLVRLAITLPNRRFFLLRHKERRVTPAEREFIAALAG